ncbi:hypothetical protein [Allomuricauda sp. R78024]|uniref:hypothetical protein n=1 Tax=Allomuricauda sp. R78024 TaxID=3093867 RepID=UPI0037C80F22
MKYQIGLLFVLINLGFINAQITDYFSETIGFSCSFVGKPTYVVKKMHQYISASRYDEIGQLLYSHNTAERIMAVIVYEELMFSGKLTLRRDQKKTIRELYRSESKVSVCSGCTFFGLATVKDLLNNIDTYGIGRKMRLWVKRELMKQAVIN